MPYNHLAGNTILLTRGNGDNSAILYRLIVNQSTIQYHFGNGRIDNIAWIVIVFLAR